MANVMFKRGTQNDLAKYLQTGASQAIEGAFYLTSDTNRLYIGKEISTGNVKAVPVNQGVITVASISALPAVSAAEQGQFYYATSENVLCVMSGSKWVQINPDTYYQITSRTSTGNLDSGIAVITDAIVEKKTTGGTQDSAGTTYNAKFGVKGENGVNVDIEAGGAYPVIKISQSAYDINAAVNSSKDTATITLTDGTVTDSINIKKGDNISFEGSGDDITISAKDTTLASSGNSLAFDANGNLTVKVSDTSGNLATANVTPTIAYAPDAGGTATQTIKFVNGTANLSVYSKAQVDEKLRGLDAMVYKGTISAKPSGNISNGDSYKATASIDFGSAGTAKVGDLVIAKGTEGSDGYITGTISWDIIPSGDDAQENTTYRTKTIEDGFVVVENDGTANGIQKGGIQLVEKDTTDSTDKVTYINIVNDSSTDANTYDQVAKIIVEHKEQSFAAGKTVEATSTDLAQKTFTDLSLSVPVLSYDKAGHITAISSQTYTIKDTKQVYDLDYLKATAGSTTTTNGVLIANATIEACLKDVSGGNTLDKASFNITSSSISLAANSNGALVMDIEWGTF